MPGLQCLAQPKAAEISTTMRHLATRSDLSVLTVPESLVGRPLDDDVIAYVKERESRKLNETTSTICCSWGDYLYTEVYKPFFNLLGLPFFVEFNIDYLSVKPRQKFESGNPRKKHYLFRWKDHITIMMHISRKPFPVNRLTVFIPRKVPK